jgi:8-oxo-dGTP pyrophosphatase MutT (NUDIX family)
MSERPWLFEHPLVQVDTVPVQTPGGLRHHIRLHMDDWVNVVAVTRVNGERRVVLVRQPRSGAGVETLEIPGGGVDRGEDPALAAVRELREETGFRPADGVEPMALGWVWSNPAIQTNRTWLYLIEPVEPGIADPDDGEDITVESVAVSEVEALLDTGRIDHSLAVVTLERALRRGLL